MAKYGFILTHPPSTSYIDWTHFTMQFNVFVSPINGTLLLNILYINLFELTLQVSTRPTLYINVSKYIVGDASMAPGYFYLLNEIDYVHHVPNRRD